MRILTDYHHGDLLESLYMLFEDRFQAELYIPIGMEWWHEGIWGLRDPAIAHQFLEHWGIDRDCGDHWEREDTHHAPRQLKLITLEQARSKCLDIVLATYSHNQVGYHRLARELGAKFGIQCGNTPMGDRFDLADFAMLSTTTPHGAPKVPHVFYHQEFDLKLFRFDTADAERDLAASFVNLLSRMPEFFQVFVGMAQAVPELRWRCYGHAEPDNPYWEASLAPLSAIAETMRAARIGIQFKRGDGYGHVVHNLFAVGKPVIASASMYADKLAAPLFVDGVTSFNVQTRTLGEVVEIVKRLAHDDEYHRQISENSYRRFKEVVNFDADAEAVKALLERVL